MKTKFKYLDNDDLKGTEINGAYLLEIAYQLKRIADVNEEGEK